MFKIKGREVIEVNFNWELNEMYEFMRRYWNTEEYNDFEIGKPTKASIEEYIYLPATKTCLVIAYPRKGKVIFSVADNPQGAGLMVASAIPVRNAFAKVYQTSLTIDHAKEMKGPAAEVCEMYADYFRQLLKEHMQ